MINYDKDRAEWAKERIRKIKDKYGDLNFDPAISRSAFEEVHYVVTISKDSALMKRCEICKTQLVFDPIVNSFPPGALVSNCCEVRYSISYIPVNYTSIQPGVVKFQTLKPITDDVWDRGYYFKHMPRECSACKTQTILRMNGKFSFEEICTNDGCHYWYGVMSG